MNLDGEDELYLMEPSLLLVRLEAIIDFLRQHQHHNPTPLFDARAGEKQQHALFHLSSAVLWLRDID